MVRRWECVRVPVVRVEGCTRDEDGCLRVDLVGYGCPYHLDALNVALTMDRPDAPIRAVTLEHGDEIHHACGEMDPVLF